MSGGRKIGILNCGRKKVDIKHNEKIKAVDLYQSGLFKYNKQLLTDIIHVDELFISTIHIPNTTCLGSLTKEYKRKNIPYRLDTIKAMFIPADKKIHSYDSQQTQWSMAIFKEVSDIFIPKLIEDYNIDVEKDEIYCLANKRFNEVLRPYFKKFYAVYEGKPVGKRMQYSKLALEAAGIKTWKEVADEII